MSEGSETAKRVWVLLSHEGWGEDTAVWGVYGSAAAAERAVRGFAVTGAGPGVVTFERTESGFTASIEGIRGGWLCEAHDVEAGAKPAGP